ncbi:hypothetical protein BU23DRAFT_193792 [Bimuria novae-zelandiae CBS 107.79]|uniref:Uncharacterized protein n=1 Tax=Bimuria novae-zelandiae CBS 107.79 TaxID=1447943 RepID=A0A6A5VW08_9PLEO|nr:hypothetical protein BU23DRAFT_193792 [Bimuria novae-zelandiae CBS 107.79]
MSVRSIATTYGSAGPLCQTFSVSKNARPSEAYLKIATLDLSTRSRSVCVNNAIEEQDSSQRERLMDCSSGLSEDMNDMSETHRPALFMTGVDGHFLRGPSEASMTNIVRPPGPTQSHQLCPINPALSKPPVVSCSSEYSSRESTMALLDNTFTRGTATPNRPLRGGRRVPGLDGVERFTRVECGG